MPTKINVKQRIEDLTHTYIFPAFPAGMLPSGLNPYHDIKRHLPGYRASTVFDVGANIGQSAQKFRKWFPQAQIYCFEPVTTSFAALQHRLKGRQNVHCFQLALGATNGTGQIRLDGMAEMFSLVPDAVEPAQTPAAALETVALTSLDAFCTNHAIQQINYLKIDTEGYDLEVLKGAEQMLQAQQIDLVQVEAGMYPANTQHVPFETLKHYLEERNYLLFGIYDQKSEWIMQQPQLRRTNPLFLAQRLIAGR